MFEIINKQDLLNALSPLLDTNQQLQALCDLAKECREKEGVFDKPSKIAGDKLVSFRKVIEAIGKVPPNEVQITPKLFLAIAYHLEKLAQSFARLEAEELFGALDC